MNCSSVRNSPTPAAPVSSSIGRSATSPELCSSVISIPSRVTDGLSLAVRDSAPGASRRQPHLVDIDLLDVGRRPADARCRPAPSTMMSSPALATSRRCSRPARPRRGRASVATIATCAVAPPSSSTMPRSRVRSYSSSSAGPMLRATRMALSGSSLLAERIAIAGQDAQQPVGEIVEIVQPIADVGIGRAQHAGARIVLHPLDRRLGREAVVDRLGQPVDPAAVVGEHAVGLEDLAVIGDRLPCRHGSSMSSIETRIVSSAVCEPAPSRPRYPRR